MSESTTSLSDGGQSEPAVSTDERSVLDRIKDNPGPALVWAAGALVLLALEFGRYVSGVLKLGGGVKFLFDGITSIPRTIEENVASAIAGLSSEALGTIAGALAHDLMGLLILFIVAFFLHDYVPLRLDNIVDNDLSPRQTLYAERGLLTGLLAAVAALLMFTPLGDIVDQEIGAWISVIGLLGDLPTMTSPEVIPNMGYRTPGGGWEGTFLGLSPKQAWGIRFTLVWVYAFACLGWAWKGYKTYRSHYRGVDWTPRDDTVRRFKQQYWGLFGLFVVFGFLVLAVFAPAVSPVGFTEHIDQPWVDSSTFQHLNDDGELETVKHGAANIDARSKGPTGNVGPWSYDPHDRWMPLGTTNKGQSMLTNLAYGARTSLIIALAAVGLGVIIAVTLSLLTAYYKGLLDVVTIFVSDTIISIPVLVLVLMLIIVFRGTWLAEPLDGGLLLALILGFAYWPGMWRSIRGPSLQVAEEEWVDAAKTYGQSPRKIMRKHMAPYIMSYIMIYASLLLGGIIITISALSFLGLGISEPTPEWGRLISDGRPFIATQSWHISTISGIAIALVVLGFNALGDGIRDAIDPEADVGSGVTGGGGG